MPTSLEKWRAIAERPSLVAFFRGLFDRIGVEIVDTGETLTVAQSPTGLELAEGIRRVDYTVRIESWQVDRLGEFAAEEKLSPLAAYRILAAIFTAATAAMLKVPELNDPLLRVLSGAETLIHVHLLPPAGTEKETGHTLIYAAQQWLVIPGLHGTPRRIYMLDTQQAMIYQRRVFRAMKRNSWLEWLAFGSWYREWRTGVSAEVR